MTEQEIFDKVAKHLLTQKEKSSDLKGDCYYRYESRLSCAAGCLLTDAEAKIADDSTINVIGTWREVISTSPSQRMIIEFGGLEKTDLITRLQLVHDNHEPSSWKRVLENLAIEKGLSRDALKEFQDA